MHLKFELEGHPEARVVGGHPALGGWNAAGGVKNGDIITIEGASQVEYKWVNGDTWEARENRRLTLPAMDAPDSSVALAVRDRAVWEAPAPADVFRTAADTFQTPAPSSSQHHHHHHQQEQQEPVRWSPAPAASGQRACRKMDPVIRGECPGRG